MHSNLNTMKQQNVTYIHIDFLTFCLFVFVTSLIVNLCYFLINHEQLVHIVHCLKLLQNEILEPLHPFNVMIMYLFYRFLILMYFCRFFDFYKIKDARYCYN
jgi:hypothetical protein